MIPPFFIAVAMLASPVATPRIEVAVASPVFEEFVPLPMDSGPCTAVYRDPFKGITDAQPDRDVEANKTAQTIASVFFTGEPPFETS